MNKNLLHFQRWFTLNNSSTQKKKKKTVKNYPWIVRLAL